MSKMHGLKAPARAPTIWPLWPIGDDFDGANKILLRFHLRGVHRRRVGGGDVSAPACAQPVTNRPSCSPPRDNMLCGVAGEDAASRACQRLSNAAGYLRGGGGACACASAAAWRREESLGLARAHREASSNGKSSSFLSLIEHRWPHCRKEAGQLIVGAGNPLARPVMAAWAK